MEHPSALGSFDRMMKAAKGKKIAVFLDYDGTLSPIVDDPDRAFMSDEVINIYQNTFTKGFDIDHINIPILYFEFDLIN